MDGLKYLAKNVGLLTVSQFSTKLITFLLIPLYTNVLSTVEYGTYDFYNSTIALLIPILTLNICDSALRFTIDKDSNKKGILSISIYHLLISLFLASILSIVNYLTDAIPILNEHPLLFILLFFAGSITGVLTNYCRGADYVKEVAISGVFGSVMVVFLNLLFLLPLHLGLIGFFLAQIIGLFCQSFYLISSIKLWRFVDLGHIDHCLHTDMLSFCKPLVLNNIFWWINGLSARYIVIGICGLAANGIFSVSYKIPSILTMLQGIFSQAWTLSAVKDYDEGDKSGFFLKMYNSYNVCMLLVCSILIVFSRDIANILYAKDFFLAWEYVPFLLISTVFGAMAGYIGGIYSAVKDSKAFARTSIYGAIINVAVTLVLVYIIGVRGAAIGAFFSYYVVWIMRVLDIKRYIKIKINLKKDHFSYLLLVIQSILLYVMSGEKLFYFYESLLFLMLVVINQETLMAITRKVVSHKKIV